MSCGKTHFPRRRAGTSCPPPKFRARKGAGPPALFLSFFFQISSKAARAGRRALVSATPPPPQNHSLEAAGSVLPLKILVGRKPRANGPSGAGLIQSYLEVDEQEPRKLLCFGMSPCLAAGSGQAWESHYTSSVFLTVSSVRFPNKRSFLKTRIKAIMLSSLLCSGDSFPLTLPLLEAIFMSRQEYRSALWRVLLYWEVASLPCSPERNQ